MSELIYFPAFPKRFKQKRHRFGHIVTIGIGGNIGDVTKTFYSLLQKLGHSSYFGLIATSPILKNPPFGYLDQPDFYNAIIRLRTNLGYLKFFVITKYLEKRFGRVKNFKNGPRPLDIDIIFFGDLNLKLKTLTIPHPEWKKRDSVIIPFMLIGGFY